MYVCMYVCMYVYMYVTSTTLLLHTFFVPSFPSVILELITNSI